MGKDLQPIHSQGTKGNIMIIKILLCLAIWFVLAIPFALALGKVIRLRDRSAPGIDVSDNVVELRPLTQNSSVMAEQAEAA